MMKSIVFIALMFASTVSFADWTLCNQASNLNFVTTVNGTDSEVHSFSNMTGTITENGEAKLKIDLASVETNNSVRNQNIQDLIFDTPRYQELEIFIKLEPETMSLLLSEGTPPLPLTVKTEINLRGIRKEIHANLLITRLQTGCLLVSTMKTIILSLTDFNLKDSLEKLTKIGGVEQIANTVSVTFSLFYRKDE